MTSWSVTSIGLL